jgi:hypothetical protein
VRRKSTRQMWMVARCWATSSSHRRDRTGRTQLDHESTDDTGSSPGAGTLFGLTAAGDGKIYFVDDGSNHSTFYTDFRHGQGSAWPTCRIFYAVAALAKCRLSISAVTSFAG